MARTKKPPGFHLPEGDLLATISAVNSQIFDSRRRVFQRGYADRHALFQASCNCTGSGKIQTRFFQKGENDYTARFQVDGYRAKRVCWTMTGATRPEFIA